MSLCRVTIEDMRLSRCVTLSDSFFLNQWRMHRDGSREGKCSRRLAFTLPNLPEDGAEKIEAQLEKWGLTRISVHRCPVSFVLLCRTVIALKCKDGIVFAVEKMVCRASWQPSFIVLSVICR